jgi:hypothetical protein
MPLTVSSKYLPKHTKVFLKEFKKEKIFHQAKIIRKKAQILARQCDN